MSKPSSSASLDTHDMQDTYDTQRFLSTLDAMFAAQQPPAAIESFITTALKQARARRDTAAELSALNELMGFYRSQSRHTDNLAVIEQALALARSMHIAPSEAWTTTLINAATGLRAAKQYARSEQLYQEALTAARGTLAPTDRRLAALHNNLSMLYSDQGDVTRAREELEQALAIIERSSVNPAVDIDVASTHTNLALLLLAQGTPASLDEALTHAQQALDIYHAGHLERHGHYAATLACYAQVQYARGQAGDAARYYEQALQAIAAAYGTDNDSYRITQENWRQAQQAALQQSTTPQAAMQQNSPKHASAQEQALEPHHDHNQASPAITPSISIDAHNGGHDNKPNGERECEASNTLISKASTAKVSTIKASASPTSPTPANITGMQLAQRYWQAYGKPLIEERYPELAPRIAAGLVGHGSECYGFDDAISRDHDFGPGFCLWLTDEDYARYGAQLERDYEQLPQDFLGFHARTMTPRASGAARRVGVFAIGDFFEAITGYRKAPEQSALHEWVSLPEATLAAATNGKIFADPLGAFSHARQAFTFMPDDARLSLISRRLGMIAQAGQYNFPRMLERGDGAAAWLALSEYITAAASLVFLINTPISAGYLPYYKWQFAALRRLSKRMAARLSPVAAQLERMQQLASAACFGGAGFGEGGAGAKPAAQAIERSIDEVATLIVQELRREGLTRSDETFLEWQRPYVEEHIISAAPLLHSL